MEFEHTLLEVIKGRELFRGWAHISSDQLANLAELGISNLIYSGGTGLPPPDMSARLRSDVRKWIAHVVDDRRINAAYLDTTTIYTAHSLLESPERESYLAPETLLDLSTFVNGVVLYDRLFHLENPYIDTTKINEILGNPPLFIAIPIESYEGERYWDGMNSIGALLTSMWEIVNQYFSSRYIPEIVDDRRVILTSWETFLDFKWNENEIWRDHNSNIFSSVGPILLKQLVETLDPLVSQNAYSGTTRLRSGIAEFIAECNMRSLFNSLVASLVELPYLPNVARLPFRKAMHERSAKIQHHLTLLNEINDEYKKVSSAYSSPNQNNLVLPFFLNVVLAKISSLSEFYEVLADIRFQTEPFRRHRADLDAAFLRRDVKEIQHLRVALQQDAKEIGNKFPIAPLSGAIAAVLAALGSTLPGIALLAIGVLTLASQMPEPEIIRLKQRVLRPEYRILSDLNDVASSMINSLPKIDELWGGLNHYTVQQFTQRLDKLKTLHYG